ncbi:MAG: hypothetical protein JKY87_01600 [Mariprofundus sp.]|nr:hypothetical protein [Mariprofundus sp.]
MGRQQSETVRVRTYAGDFELQKDDAGNSVGFDAYLRYVESNHGLHRVAFDELHTSRKAIKAHELVGTTKSAKTLHRRVKNVCHDWARYVVVLFSPMK